jgi:hypothetical protein
MVIDLLAEYLDFQVLNDEAISTLKRKATRENPIPFKTQKPPPSHPGRGPIFSSLRRKESNNSSYGGKFGLTNSISGSNHQNTATKWRRIRGFWWIFHSISL